MTPSAPPAAPSNGWRSGDPWRFRLYVAGMTPTAERALANLEAICRRYLRDRYTLEVIDVQSDPAAAEAEQIIAIPTVVREQPGPPRRVIGDLSSTDRALAGLGITPGVGATNRVDV